jgi:hypothetical protein
LSTIPSARDEPILDVAIRSVQARGVEPVLASLADRQHACDDVGLGQGELDLVVSADDADGLAPAPGGIPADMGAEALSAP